MISPCDLFQFKITSEIINQFNIWLDILDVGSARRKASTYKGQHNKEKLGQAFMH
jgi:hypothetical protein